jgi:hypothetical protein
MPLDVFQQVFSLSLASNLVNDYTGPLTGLQQALQFGLTQLVFPAVDNQWKLVWGPVVWKKKPEVDSTGPDNSWYIAFHPNLQFEDGSVHPTYVIAVAGTPVRSTYAWFGQNFAVDSVVDFKDWVAGGIQSLPVAVRSVKDIVPGNAYIAMGTATGVHILLTSPAPEGAASAGTTLLDFVKNLDQSSSPRFIATGHSLGGALSPSLALGLVTAGVFPADLTLTYPTAGPSPGGKAFTELFVATLPPRPSQQSGSYKSWNRNLVNTLDIVPQAWSVRKDLSPKQNLHNIPPVYGLPVVPFVRGITVVLAFHSLRAGVIYQPLPGQYFTAAPPSKVPENLTEFIEEFGSQHAEYYAKEVGIPLPELGEPLGRTYKLREKSKEEKRFEHPIIGEFEWAREHPEEAKKEIGEIEEDEEVKSFLSED